MLFFWPRIGEKKMKAAYRIVGNHFFENFDRIVFDDKKIGKIFSPYFAQELSDAGAVYFNTDVIGFGILFGDEGGCRSHAETYFYDDLVRVAEQIAVIDVLVRKGNAPLGR